MYPLKHKISIGAFLIAAALLLGVLIFHALSDFPNDERFFYQVAPYLFALCAAVIITAPIILEANGHWLTFFISAVLVSIFSLGTGRHIYIFQTLVLLGLCIVVNTFSKKEIALLSRKSSAIERIEESTNMLESERIRTENLNDALSERLTRYRSLREIGETFSAGLSLQEIGQLAVDTAYNAIPGSDAALLFMVDEKKMRLELMASRKKSDLPKIKSKNGDIFDQWVFKERQPLNVSDINSDFRFDYKPLPGEREFGSLISVPLISQFRIVGLLRLNSKEKNAYSFDDLRLLDFTSDLVSSAVNNARLYDRTRELSVKDSLTGFYIHRYLKERLAEETEQAKVQHQPLSIVVMDIDHFKDYNDRYGHSAGDKVLLEISDIIRDNTKSGYVVARYGGEEFVMILPNTDKERAQALTESIREGISSHPFILRRQETHVTISAGVVSYIEEMKDSEGLLKAADFHLYRAKKEGRNKVCVG
ncbi:MAG: diguanylate cyclase [Candidatus Omnitrophica bacterium]|nr:diguanylate cyclase [Candidatus Omnitrophota bacterium]